MLRVQVLPAEAANGGSPANPYGEPPESGEPPSSHERLQLTSLGYVPPETVIADVTTAGTGGAGGAFGSVVDPGNGGIDGDDGMGSQYSQRVPGSVV